LQKEIEKLYVKTKFSTTYLMIMSWKWVINLNGLEHPEKK